MKPDATVGPASAEELRASAVRQSWYHTIDLGSGVVTPGYFDTRQVVDTVGFPADLAGRRCLDVGTFDGFWAFQMERRGAEEVVAIDLLDATAHDWPANTPPERIPEGRKGDGFELAHRALRSAVKRVERSVYDLDPDEDGEFDLIYVGSLLLHLRDPVGALERVRAVAADRVILVDAIDLPLTLLLRNRPVAHLDGWARPRWWKPNLAGLVRMAQAAGLGPTETPRRFYMPFGAGHARPRLTPRTLARTARRAREERLPGLLLGAVRGDPHGVVHARPAEPLRDLPGRPSRSVAWPFRTPSTPRPKRT